MSVFIIDRVKGWFGALGVTVSWHGFETNTMPGQLSDKRGWGSGYREQTSCGDGTIIIRVWGNYCCSYENRPLRILSPVY